MNFGKLLAGAAVGGSMLFSLFIGVPALLVGLAGLACGVVLTILLRGPPPLIALVVLAALFAASGFVDLEIGPVALLDIASLVYGALAVTVSVLWFFRRRRQFSADAGRDMGTSIGLLIPLKVGDPAKMAAALKRAEQLAKERDPEEDRRILAGFGDVDPVNWSIEEVRRFKEEELGRVSRRSAKRLAVRESARPFVTRKRGKPKKTGR